VEEPIVYGRAPWLLYTNLFSMRACHLGLLITRDDMMSAPSLHYPREHRDSWVESHRTAFSEGRHIYTG